MRMHGVARAFCCEHRPLCLWHFILTVAPVWISQYPAAKDLLKEKTKECFLDLASCSRLGFVKQDLVWPLGRRRDAKISLSDSGAQVLLPVFGTQGFFGGED